MSRGHGRVERAILDALAPSGPGIVDRALPIGLLAQAVFGGHARTPAERASVSRALNKLRAEGLVEPLRRGRSVWWQLEEREYRRLDRERAKRAGEERRRQQRERTEQQEQGGPRSTDEVLRELLRPPRAPVDRLIKLLNMLSSNHDGEVLAAARQVEAERRRLRKSWEELLRSG
jgi:DNA-binding transcriptional ArsR family regulator